MIDFPSSPVNGQAYTAGGRSWVWNGTGWERQVNRGQTVGIFYEVGPIVMEQVAALPTPIGTAFQLVNYV